MATAPNQDETNALIDRFLNQRGHETPDQWETAAKKKQCPECGGLHETAAVQCSVCGWAPTY